MEINNKIKDTYHLTTEKLKKFVKKDPILTKRVAALSVALIMVVSAYALTKPIINVDVRNPTNQISLVKNTLETRIGASLGINKNLSTSGNFSISGPLLSGAYDSLQTILGIKQLNVPALKYLNVTLSAEVEESNQTLGLTFGIGDTFANQTSAFGVYGFAHFSNKPETVISAQIGAEKDINNFTPFGSLTANATSNPNEKWYSELEAGIKYHFNNGSIITTSGIAQFDNEKIKVQEGEVSYSQNNLTYSLSYLPEGKKVEVSIEAEF